MKYSVRFPAPKTAYSGALKLEDVQIGFDEDDDAVALVIESLAAILHCSPDQIGRGGIEGQPITIDITRTVLECAIRMAADNASESARREVTPPVA